MANLVLSGRSIDSIDEIAENFVEEEVVAAFRNGILVAWLEEFGYDDEASRVKAITNKGSLVKNIVEALDLDLAVVKSSQKRLAEIAAKKSEEKAAEEKRFAELAARKAEEEKRRAKLQVHESAEQLSLGKGCVDSGATAQEESTTHVKLAEKCLEEGNIKEAVKHYSNAAEQGDADALFDLGNRYLVNSDYKEAERCFLNAAKMGHVEAQCCLGMLYQLGLGGHVDHLQAVKWLHEAAKQGFARAQYELGMCYVKGLGVPRSHANALEWFHMAAQKGYALAEKMISHLA